MKERALTYEEFIALAKANYTKGGDGYVECWDDRTFTYFVKEFGPITKTQALQMFAAAFDEEKEERGNRQGSCERRMVTMKKLNITYDTAEIENGEKIVGETCYTVKMQDALAEQLLRDPGSCGAIDMAHLEFLLQSVEILQAGDSWTAASNTMNW